MRRHPPAVGARITAARAALLAVLLAPSSVGEAPAQGFGRPSDSEIKPAAKAASYRVTIQSFSWRAFGAEGG